MIISTLIVLSDKFWPWCLVGKVNMDVFIHNFGGRASTLCDRRDQCDIGHNSKTLRRKVEPTNSWWMIFEAQCSLQNYSWLPQHFREEVDPIMIFRVALVSYGEVVEDVDLFIEVMAHILVNVNVNVSKLYLRDQRCTFEELKEHKAIEFCLSFGCQERIWLTSVLFLDSATDQPGRFCWCTAPINSWAVNSL